MIQLFDYEAHEEEVPTLQLDWLADGWEGDVDGDDAAELSTVSECRSCPSGGEVFSWHPGEARGDWEQVFSSPAWDQDNANDWEENEAGSWVQDRSGDWEAEGSEEDLGDEEDGSAGEPGCMLCASRREAFSPERQLPA